MKRHAGLLLICLMLGLNLLQFSPAHADSPRQKDEGTDEDLGFNSFVVGKGDWASFHEKLSQLPGFFSRVPEKEFKTKPNESSSDVVVSIFRFFAEYARRIQDDHDNELYKEGDFRSFLTQKLSSHFEQIKFYSEISHTTFESDWIRMRLDAAGAGFRFEVQPVEDGKVTFTLMPLYGEMRKFNSVSGASMYGADMMLRSSVSAKYRQKFGDRVEPGMQVVFQPSIIDVNQFRIYTEFFVRLRAVGDSSTDKYKKNWAIQEISVVPKVIYWRSTDKAGIGDSVDRIFGNTYLQLKEITYGFLNLEFRIRM